MKTRPSNSSIVTTAAIAAMLFSAPSYAGIFITGGAQQYISPDDPIDKPSTGVRIGAGYEFPLNMGGGGVTLLMALLA